MNTKQYVFVPALLVSLMFTTACPAQRSNYQQTIAAPCDTLLPANLLNSERIAKKFGGYGIDVLYSTDKLRISDLYDDKRITRTLAIVTYPPAIDSAFAQEHRAIVKGSSIGSTFKAAGWKIDKKNIYFGEIAPSSTYSKLYERMGIQPTTLAIWTYVFHIQKNGRQYPYVTISEIYHPAYLSLANLKCMTPDANTHRKIPRSLTHQLQNIPTLIPAQAPQ